MAVTWWLGPPGLLQSLRPPLRGIERTAAAVVTPVRLLSGAQVAQRSTRTARTVQYTWTWLAPAEWTTLAALHHRQFGPGPYALLDPSTINHLSSNQASGTDARQDATGFVVAGGEVVTSSTAQAFQGFRGLSWTLPASASSKICTISAPRTAWFGWPTPAAEPWALSGQVRLGSGTAATTALALQWLDATGAQLSETVGAAATPSTSGWAAMAVLGQAPTGCVYVQPRIKVTGAVSLSTTMYLDALSLERAYTVGTWMPGEGLPAVSVLTLAETVPVLPRRSVQLTLTEVGV